MAGGGMVDGGMVGGDMVGGDMAGGGMAGGLGGAGGGGEERCGVAGGPVRGGRAARLGAHERASLLVGPVAVPGAGVVVVGSVGSAPRAVGRGMTSARRSGTMAVPGMAVPGMAVPGMAVPGMAVPGMAKSWSGPCRCAGAPASPVGRTVAVVSVPAARMPLMVR